MVLEDTNWRQVQRAFAADSFHACKTESFDTVLVMKEFHKTLVNDKTHKIDCWRGKALCLVKTDNPKSS